MEETHFEIEQLANILLMWWWALSLVWAFVNMCTCWHAFLILPHKLDHCQVIGSSFLMSTLNPYLSHALKSDRLTAKNTSDRKCVFTESVISLTLKLSNILVGPQFDAASVELCIVGWVSSGISNICLSPENMPVGALALLTPSFWCVNECVDLSICSNGLLFYPGCLLSFQVFLGQVQDPLTWTKQLLNINKMFEIYRIQSKKGCVLCLYGTDIGRHVCNASSEVFLGQHCPLMFS